MFATSTTNNYEREGYSAKVIANEFIQKAIDEGRGLSQMQVQKLIFIAHGYSLAILDRPLVSDSIHAWRHGPVVKNLWAAWPYFGPAPKATLLPVGESLIPPSKRDDTNEIGIIDAVWNTYGHMSGEELSRLTHQDGSPWSTVFGNNIDIIPNTLISSYYKKIISS